MLINHDSRSLLAAAILDITYNVDIGTENKELTKKKVR